METTDTELHFLKGTNYKLEDQEILLIKIKLSKKGIFSLFREKAEF